MTPTQTKPIDPQDLADVLRSYGVRCGNSRSRFALAQRLAGEGLGVVELASLCTAIEERGLPLAQTAGIIGTILKTAKGWREFIADVFFAKDCRRVRSPVCDETYVDLHRRNRETPETEATQAAEVHGMTLEQFDAFKYRRMIAALVHFDRYTISEVSTLHDKTEAYVESCCAEFPPS